MNAILRWGRFNVVGAMGMVVQLAALAIFNRAMHGHYLYALIAAIELTLLHNFIWHVHYTWQDRRHGGSVLQQAVRFHLSNGAVSMAGNIVGLRLLVGEAHLPLVVSNAAAIIACSFLNFHLGNRWTFLERKSSAQSIALEDFPIEPCATPLCTCIGFNCSARRRGSPLLRALGTLQGGSAWLRRVTQGRSE